MGNKINIQETIEKARKQIAGEPNLSPALKATFELLVNLCLLLAQKWLPKNSKNSNTPPSADPNREKSSKAKGNRKPGGQEGHPGVRLEPAEKAEKAILLKIDRRTLPPGEREAWGWEKRQVTDIEITRAVTEYRAEIAVNEKGEMRTAEFPAGLVQAAQYGEGVKAHAVYMPAQQLIPCERVSDHFTGQMGIPLSAGSACNFKEEAYNKLEGFEGWVKERLKGEAVLNADETGINIGGKRVCLHNSSSPLYTLYEARGKRGKEAMDEIGVIVGSGAILVHDHWKAYYRYEGRVHWLRNAHHLRELEQVKEEGGTWAQPVMDFLVKTDKEVKAAGGKLDEKGQTAVREEYRRLLKEGEKECPAPPEKPPGQRGRAAKSRAGNLLERLGDYEKEVPFTNNLAERDLRMMKVHQKISGCFRSWEGARIFCRIRSYLSTRAKHDVSAAEALKLLFSGKLPHFLSSETTPIPAE